MRINTNIAAMNAQANNSTVNKSLTNSLEKLSSGLKINKAADDASGMAIADKLRTQASSLGQGIANANSGAALIQIADKAMGEQSAILDTVKTKLIQASTSTTSSEGREAIRKDITKLLEQFNSISQQTTYNGVNLLNEKGSEFKFQIGEYEYSNVSMELEYGVNTEELGALATMTNKAEGTMEFYDDVKLDGTKDGGEVTVKTSGTNAITIASPATGTNMSVEVSGENIQSLTSDQDLIIKTTDADLIETLDAVASTATTDLTRNGEGYYTLTAAGTISFGEAKIDFDKVELTAATASTTIGIVANQEDVTIKKLGIDADADITIDTTAGNLTGSITDTNKVKYASGLDVKEGSVSVKYDPTSTTTASANDYAIGINTVASTAVTDQSFTVDAEDVKEITISGSASAASVTFTTSDKDMLEKLEIQAQSSSYLVNNGDNTFTLTASGAGGDASISFGEDGFDLTDLQISGLQGHTDLGQAEKIYFTTQDAVTVTNESTDPLSVTAVDMADKANDADSLRGANISKSVVGDTLDAILAVGEGELTSDLALKFLDSIDAAITQLNGIRSEFGSTQNQLETAIRNMMVTQVNIKNAESVIRDVDYAQESANFNKMNIISQAGTYALSQANNIQQNVMKLLQ